MSRLLKKMNMRPRDLLRTNEPAYQQLGLKNPDLTDDRLVAFMVAHPDLIQRPILEVGDRAVLGRPLERMTEWLDAVFSQ